MTEEKDETPIVATTEEGTSVMKIPPNLKDNSRFRELINKFSNQTLVISEAKELSSMIQKELDERDRNYENLIATTKKEEFRLSDHHMKYLYGVLYLANCNLKTFIDDTERGYAELEKKKMVSEARLKQIEKEKTAKEKPKKKKKTWWLGGG
jgi:transcriptional regulator of heat shock response